MLEFAKRSPASLGEILEESAARRGIARVIVEKDFWVCYTLLLLFTAPELKDHLVFKSGTSLSPLFGEWHSTVSSNPHRPTKLPQRFIGRRMHDCFERQFEDGCHRGVPLVGGSAQNLDMPSRQFDGDLLLG